MSYNSRSYSPDTPPSSSGVGTPTNSQPPSVPSSFSNMWTGLMRRFSSESTAAGEPPFPTYDTYGVGGGGPPKDGVHGVFVPPLPHVRRVLSPFRPPPLDPVALHGYKDSTPASARLLTPAIAEEIRIMVPERLRITEDWRLVYSLEQDGASLATLYKKCRVYEGRRLGFVIVVRDLEGGVSHAIPLVRAPGRPANPMSCYRPLAPT